MSRIQVNFQPDPGGIYIIETKLAVPIPIGDGEALHELRAQMEGNELPPEIGFCGMLQPAVWQADGTLVAAEANPTGQIFNLVEALRAFNQQCAGVQVPNPYILNPDLADIMIENNNIIGWRRLAFALPELAQAGNFQASAEEDGSQPSIQSQLNTASMYGYGLGSVTPPTQASNLTMYSPFSWVSNLWDSASVPEKIGIAALGVGLTLVAWKFAVIAAGVGAVKAAIALGATAAAGVAGFAYAVGQIVVMPISELLGNVKAGMDARRQGQPMPPGLAAGIGYGGQVAMDTMVGVSNAIRQGGQSAINAVNSLSNLLDKVWNGAGKIFKGLLVAGGIGLGGFLLYKLLSKPQRR